MPHIPGHEVVGTGSIGAFDEFIVVGIVRHLYSPHRIYKVCPFSMQVEELPPKGLIVVSAAILSFFWVFAILTNSSVALYELCSSFVTDLTPNLSC